MAGGVSCVSCVFCEPSLVPGFPALTYMSSSVAKPSCLLMPFSTEACVLFIFIVLVVFLRHAVFGVGDNRGQHGQVGQVLADLFHCEGTVNSLPFGTQIVYKTPGHGMNILG
ncbi:hypothetical protein V8F20_005439, partial [Naviculisporaceae sp. PSN 640]